jgi:large subunit ribosomal protein L6
MVSKNLLKAEQNIVFGLTAPFVTSVLVRGIGYKISLVTCTVSKQTKEFCSPRYLLTRVGYSYFIYTPLPDYLGVKTSYKERKLTMFSKVKQCVATFADYLYKLRPPSVYTGRGIRFKGLVVRRKLGKKDTRKGRLF